jgi:hypothetical protein
MEQVQVMVGGVNALKVTWLYLGASARVQNVGLEMLGHLLPENLFVCDVRALTNVSLKIPCTTLWLSKKSSRPKALPVESIEGLCTALPVDTDFSLLPLPELTPRIIDNTSATGAYHLQFVSSPNSKQ